jgi:hypothetical protein
VLVPLARRAQPQRGAVLENDVDSVFVRGCVRGAHADSVPALRRARVSGRSERSAGFPQRA